MDMTLSVIIHSWSAHRRWPTCTRTVTVGVLRRARWCRRGDYAQIGNRKTYAHLETYRV